MQVTTASILDMSNKNFIIPSFQRAYSWEKEQWEELFDDLKLVISKKTPHFIGSIVIQKQTSTEFIVIDGQQRLTTI